MLKIDRGTGRIKAKTLILKTSNDLEFVIVTSNAKFQ